MERPDKKEKKKDKKKEVKSDGKKQVTVAAAPAPAKKERNLIIMDGSTYHDWMEIWRGRTLADGTPIRVLQASWIETSVTHYPDASGTLFWVAPIADSFGQVKPPESASVRPDFLLARNQVRGPEPASDRRNVLYGLLMARAPAMNSLHSMYMDLERPVMYGELAAIEARVGHDKFPLIPITYYASYAQMTMPGGDFPQVVKVSHAHRGMGKIKVDNMDTFRDTATILALYDSYATSEPFVKCQYGIRVQKVGPRYRVYKKNFTGSGWKSQFGGADLQEIPLTPQYKLWADECAKCYGGMDLLAVDALHSVDGKDYILELNGTAIGILSQHWQADSELIRDMIIERMNRLYVKSYAARKDEEFLSEEERKRMNP